MEFIDNLLIPEYLQNKKIEFLIRINTFKLLKVISGGGESNMSKIARKIGLGFITVIRKLKLMGELGFVCSTKENNRKHFTLTQKGKTLMKNYNNIYIQLNNRRE